MLIKSYETLEEGRESSLNWGKQPKSVGRLSWKDSGDVHGGHQEGTGSECKAPGGGITDRQARLGSPFGSAKA